MRYAVYSKICELVYTGEEERYLFYYAFLTIEWNIIAGSNNIVKMHINHV